MNCVVHFALLLVVTGASAQGKPDAITVRESVVAFRAETGTVQGTIAVVSENAGKFVRGEPHASIVLSRQHKTVRIRSDEIGDFVVPLPSGTYCIQSVLDQSGHSVPISRRQAKCFTIRKGKSTRFDVIIVSR